MRLSASAMAAASRGVARSQIVSTGGLCIDYRQSVPPSVLLSSFLGAPPRRGRGFGGGDFGSGSSDAGFGGSSKRQGRSGWWRLRIGSCAGSPAGAASILGSRSAAPSSGEGDDPICRGVPYSARMRSLSALCSGPESIRWSWKSTRFTVTATASGVMSLTKAANLPRPSDCRNSGWVRSRGARKRASSSLLAKRIAQLESASRTLSELICLMRWCAMISAMFWLRHSSRMVGIFSSRAMTFWHSSI